MKKTASNDQLNGRLGVQTTIKKKQKIKFWEKRSIKDRALKDLYKIFKDSKGVSGQKALKNALLVLMQASLDMELGKQVNHLLDV